MAFGAFEGTFGNVQRTDRRGHFLRDPQSLETEHMSEERHGLFERILRVEQNSELVEQQYTHRNLIEEVKYSLEVMADVKVKTIPFQQQDDRLVASINSTQQLTAMSKKKYSISDGLYLGLESLSKAVLQVAREKALNPKDVYDIVSPFFVFYEEVGTMQPRFLFLELNSQS